MRRDVPSVLGTVGDAADVEAVALAERVVGEAAMPAALDPMVVADDARIVRQVLMQELRERPLADEADAGAVLLFGDGEAGLTGELAHLALRELAERHQHVDEILGGHGVQEVALILAGVHALAQLRYAVNRRHPRVVARRDLGRRRAAARNGASRRT